MKKTFLIIPFLFLVGIFIAGFASAEKTPVKCLIQMTNYSGEGAYVIVSLIDTQGEYVETLYVQGKDPEWYSELTAWWNFYGKTKPNIDAISGETIKGGERTVAVLHIPSEKINTGYSLRFESSVEDKDYFKTDLQFPLTSENLKSKQEGSGFIRYVKMLMK